MFITFEGGEGSGKSTLISHIYHDLKERGYSVIATREPGGCLLAEQVRPIILSPDGGPVCPEAELLLYLAARAQHVLEVIQPALARGDIVLCDRFNDSTVAYQGAGRGLGVKRTKQMCDWTCHSLAPDLTLLLDIDPVTGLSRATKHTQHDRIEKESLDFHMKVRQVYLELAKANPNRIRVIDGSLPSEEVLKSALQAINTHLL